MNSVEWESIKEIIDNDVRSKNLDDLKKLRNYLNQQMTLLDTGCEMTHPKNFDILNLELSDFLDIYLPKDPRFQRLNLCIAMSRIKDPAFVIDTLGIGKKYLLKQRGVGEYTVSKYEELLSDFGYSLEKKLPTV